MVHKSIIMRPRQFNCFRVRAVCAHIFLLVGFYVFDTRAGEMGGGVVLVRSSRQNVKYATHAIRLTDHIH